MRIKGVNNAKLIVTIASDKVNNIITTTSVFDNRTQSYWTKEQIHKRGIETFLDTTDLKQTLNWNLNGDESKYQFKWGITVNKISEGRAWIFH